MEEKELFNFGDKELNINSLLNNITSNQQSYLDYYSNSIPDSKLFIEKVNYIKEGIKNGNITTNGSGIYQDTNGNLSKDDKLMNNALHFVDVIARAQSKKERALTKEEINKKEADQKLKKEELERQKIDKEREQSNIKPDFTPPEGWSVASSFAHSFNQNGQIPYDLLQQLVTTDTEGNSVYTDLHTQLDKNFDSVSKQLDQFNGTESYINNINLFKQALKDGDLSPQDRFLGMELGFQNSELDKLNALIKYKIASAKVEEETPVKEVVEENSVPELIQNPLESDSDFKKRTARSQGYKNYYTKVMDNTDFSGFTASKSIKKDSEEEFQKHLRKYILNWLVTAQDETLTYKHYNPMLTGQSYIIAPLHDITIESLQYMNPELYNELGLKYFSNHSASKMYKHFKDLVDKQNKEKVATKQENGGILKAQNGLKAPWRLNFDGTAHQMDDIYKLFTENTQSYDSKQMADTFNKLNSDEYKSLNFTDKDNTLGFKNWNTIFNNSGLNNLFGYNENKSDYLGVTTRSRRSFIDYLKNKNSINTGNGNLSWNPTLNQWEYTDWVDKNSNPEVTTKAESEAKAEAKVEVEPNNGINDGAKVEVSKLAEKSQQQSNISQSNVEAPEISDLTLNELNLRKPLDLNRNGIINSLAGYIANDAANVEKRKIQKNIPIYQEVMAPEKAFKTAYTYDLEKSKNEIMAEATNFKPITSDADTYYSARNDAIKNARAYTTKLDTEINNIVHQTTSDNQDIAFDNAVRRTDKVNTNAKYLHDWNVEQKQGEVDYIEARNQSFQNLNKEFKHNIVTDARRRQRRRDAFVNRHVLTGINTSPSNYIKGWTKHHDLIWYKGQNGKLETDQEQIEYQQLVSIVNQASADIFAQYENIKYPGMGNLHINNVLKESYDPSKHGVAVVGAKGMKIDKQKIGNFIKKLK